EARQQRDADDEADNNRGRHRRHRRRGAHRHRDVRRSEPLPGEDAERQEPAGEASDIAAHDASAGEPMAGDIAADATAFPDAASDQPAHEHGHDAEEPVHEAAKTSSGEDAGYSAPASDEAPAQDAAPTGEASADAGAAAAGNGDEAHEEEAV